MMFFLASGLVSTTHAHADILHDALTPRVTPPSLSDPAPPASEPVSEPRAEAAAKTQSNRPARSATARPLGLPDGSPRADPASEADRAAETDPSDSHAVTTPNANGVDADGKALVNPSRAGSPSPARPRAESSGFSALMGNHFVRTAVSLGFVLALMVALAIGAKKLTRKYAGRSLAAAMGPGGASPAGVLEILGRYPVARGQSLVLLKIDRRVLLLSHTVPAGRLRAAAGATFTTLSEITDPEEVASILWRVREQSGQNDDERFGSILRQSEATYSAIGRSRRGIADAHVPNDVESAMRLHAASKDGDRVELLNPSGVLRISDNGRQWTTDRAEEPERAAHIGASVAAFAPANGPGAARVMPVVSSPPSRFAPVQPADPRDPMTSLRLRLSGLQGRGVGDAGGVGGMGGVAS